MMAFDYRLPDKGFDDIKKIANVDASDEQASFNYRLTDEQLRMIYGLVARFDPFAAGRFVKQTEQFPVTEYEYFLEPITE